MCIRDSVGSEMCIRDRMYSEFCFQFDSFSDPLREERLYFLTREKPVVELVSRGIS
jgi:hypothetical protein